MPEDRNSPESDSRNTSSYKNSDLRDSRRDEERLKADEASLDLPDVRDIPGQEHIHVAPLGEMADTTISSDDEEGVGVFEDDIEDETLIVMGSEADIPREDRQALERMDNLNLTRGDDEVLVRALPDNADDEDEALNETINVSGSDLDMSGTDEDDLDENIGEEDEENNHYSLGSDSEQEGGTRG